MESQRLIVNDAGIRKNGVMLFYSISLFLLTLLLLIGILTLIFSVLSSSRSQSQQVITCTNATVSCNCNNSQSTNSSQITTSLIAGEDINKGAAVSSCGGISTGTNNRVCLFETLAETGNVLIGPLEYPYNNSGYTIKNTVQDLGFSYGRAYVQHIEVQTKQHLIFYAIISTDAYSFQKKAHPLDLTSEQFESPLATNEYYQLHGVKAFRLAEVTGSTYELSYLVVYSRISSVTKIAQMKSVLINVRYITNTGGLVSFERKEVNGKQFAITSLQEGVYDYNIFDKERFTINYLRIGDSDSYALIIIYSDPNNNECHVDTFKYNNSVLSLLQLLKGIDQVTCDRGLTSFQSQSQLILTDIAQVTVMQVDVYNGAVAVVISATTGLASRDYISLKQIRPTFSGEGMNNAHPKDYSNHNILGVFVNEVTGYVNVKKIVFDGVSVTVNRAYALPYRMKNVRVSYGKNSFQFIYEKGDSLMVRMLGFKNNVPTLGVEFEVGEISPRLYNLIVTPVCEEMGSCYNIMQERDTQEFDLTHFSLPVNSNPIIGIALNEAKSGASVEVALSGVVDIHSLEDLQIGMKYYAVIDFEMARKIGSVTIASELFGNEREDYIGVAVSSKQILLKNFVNIK
ncbi:hypothetical protein ABK040_002747 [Willaertia magna]